MERTETFFSIVIPTCDRPQLLQHTLKAALNVDYSNYEVVVSDNFSTPETQEVVNNLKNDKVRYFRTELRLSMVDNWEFAYSQALGDYIIILGDDDGIARLALKKLDKIIQSTSAELITWRNRPYWHPDWPTKERNHFSIGKKGEMGLSIISSRHVLRMAGKLDHVSASYFPHGSRFCFSKGLGRRVAKRTGQVFDIPYPDFTSGLYMLAELMDTFFVYYTGTITFTTYSFKSNAAGYLLRTKGSTERIRDFISEFSQPVFPFVPLKTHNLWNGHAECVLRAKNKYQLPDNILKFDYANYFYLCYQSIIDKHFDDPVLDSETQLNELMRALIDQSEVIREEFNRLKTNYRFRSLINQVKEGTRRRVIWLLVKIMAVFGSYSIYLDGRNHGFANLSELCAIVDELIKLNGFSETFYFE